MKRLLTLVAFFATLQASAQQVNPVPDYVFRNQMSVGRGTVTDTAAYFSIGPRYGATKGFMPPIVGDTATFSSGKRNGLLIFSVQKNKFLYWDSVRVQWSDMAGGSGSYILAGDTSAMLAPYLRKADTSSMLTNYIRHAGYGLTKSGQSFLVDTLNIATRAWRQKGLDSLAALEVSGSGTTNYVAKFTAGSTIGNSQIFDNGTNVGIGITTGMSERFNVASSTANANASISSSWASGGAFLRFGNVTNADGLYVGYNNPAGTLFGGLGGANGGVIMGYGAYPIGFGTNATERLRIFANGRVFIGASPTDAGYQLDVNGTLRSVNGANFATTSGQVGIGKTSPSAKSKLDVEGNIDIADGSFYYLRNAVANTGTYGMYYSNSAPKYPIRLAVNADPTNNRFFEIGWHKNDNKDSTWNPTFSVNSYNAETFINTTTDAGDYKLQVAGGIYATGNASNSAIQIQSGQAIRNDGSLYIDVGTSGSGIFNLRTGTLGNNAIYAHNNGRVGFNTNVDNGYLVDVFGTFRTTNGANFATSSGNVGVGTSTPTATASKAINIFGASAELHFTNSASGTTGTDGLTLLYSASDAYFFNYESGFISFGTANTERGRINSAGEWIIDASGTDAGDYKLQVVGNARIGTGKLDIASNTTFGLGVARSGTSEVAGQIYNSNGILYFGAESSAGGQIFSGSSAYAAVIGSGANYPLQFATNNITRATMTTSGNLLLGFTTDSYFLKLQVNGSIFSNNQVLAQGVNAQIAADSSTNISPLYISNQSLTGSSAQGLFYGSTTWNTTGNPSLIDLAITNTASGSDANYIKISDGSNIFRVTKAAEVVTAAPTGGSIRKWKLGEAATVSPTSPNRTIRVEIDGTVYYLHAKTTND